MSVSVIGKNMQIIFYCNNVEMLSRMVVLVIKDQSRRGIRKVLQDYVVDFTHSDTREFYVLQTIDSESVVFRAYRLERGYFLSLCKLILL